MAISPTVTQYQNPQKSSDKSVFNKKFSELAFTLLNSKFTELANNVITFKVIESDVEKGFGVAAFIVRNGNDVVYIPTVMVNGKIESCETLYNKKEDSLKPLTKDVVKAIVDSKYSVNPKLVGTVRTEDTTQVFKNMFRPPTSSNPMMLGYYNNQSTPVTAGCADISSFPNICKTAVAKALSDNPQLIKKIAEFYPIDSLTSKLACAVVPTTQVKYSDDIYTIVKIDDLTEKTADSLSEQERSDMLRDGFIAKYAENDVHSVATFASDMVSRLNLTEVCLCKNKVNAIGSLLRLNNLKVVSDKAIFDCNYVYLVSHKGLRPLMYAQNLIVKDFSTGIKAKDLLKVPGATIADEWSYNGDFGGIVFVPTGKGYVKGTGFCKGAIVTDLEDSIHIGDTVVLTDAINVGTVQTGDIIYCPKKESIIVPLDEDVKSSAPYIQNIGQAYHTFRKLNTSVKLVTDNIHWHIKEAGTQKTFTSKADCVGHLIKTYGMSKSAVDMLFAEREVVLEKLGVADGNIATQVPVPAPALQQNPQVDTQVIEAAANIADPQVLDTGLIASLASNPDIKLQLVDLCPTFEDTVTKLGKTILLFTTAAEELQLYYGTEQYTLMLKSLRTVFTTLGDIVEDLKKFINFR